MYWLQLSLARAIDVNNELGGIFVSDFSTNSSPSGCFNPMVKTSSVFCDVIDRTNEYKHKQLAVNIFPNPVNDNLTLKFSELPNSNVILNLYDLVGRRIVSEEFFPSNNLQLNVSNLAQGTYFVEIKIGVSSTTQKIVKF